MGAIFFYRENPEPDFKDGDTVVISKRVKVQGFIGRNIIHGSDGKNYHVKEWGIEYVTPMEWEDAGGPVAGDIWLSNGVEYVALSHKDGVMLSPMIDDGRFNRIYEDGYAAFLKSRPVLIRASSSR